MDLSVAAPIAYLPGQALARDSGARADSAPAARGNASSDERRVRAEASPASPEALKAREESARKKDPGAEVARSPGFTFEFEGRREVMKVHNGKGILIYQVPSKGQLALIEAEDNAQQNAPQVRLIA